jgi:hypothetical protein
MVPIAFPENTQWQNDENRAAYSCGGSRGLAPRSLFTSLAEGPSRLNHTSPAQRMSKRSRARQGKAFFFEKKKQKTFMNQTTPGP